MTVFSLSSDSDMNLSTGLRDFVTKNNGGLRPKETVIPVKPLAAFSAL